jgi:hypothetical protein
VALAEPTPADLAHGFAPAWASLEQSESDSCACLEQGTWADSSEFSRAVVDRTRGVLKTDARFGFRAKNA